MFTFSPATSSGALICLHRTPVRSGSTASRRVVRRGLYGGG